MDNQKGSRLLTEQWKNIMEGKVRRTIKNQNQRKSLIDRLIDSDTVAAFETYVLGLALLGLMVSILFAAHCSCP